MLIGILLASRDGDRADDYPRLTPLGATRDAVAPVLRKDERVQSGYWQDLTTTDFRLVDPEAVIALLPVAAIEQHGPHLPLGTDALINDGIVRAALERLPPRPALLVLPTLSIGASLEHQSFAGTLERRGRSRFRPFGSTSDAASHVPASASSFCSTRTAAKNRCSILVALRLRAELEMLVVRATYFSFGTPPGLFDAQKIVHDIHGGEVETSLLLHLRPDLVRRDALADFKGLPHELAARHSLLGAEKPVGIGWLSEDLHAAGVCGNAARADAERGAKLLDYLAGRLATLIGEVGATPLTILK